MAANAMHPRRRRGEESPASHRATSHAGVGAAQASPRVKCPANASELAPLIGDIARAGSAGRGLCCHPVHITGNAMHAMGSQLMNLVWELTFAVSIALAAVRWPR
jgi:hypothetical protein